MDVSDPHVHVTVDLGAPAVVRDRLAATFGLAADAPIVVVTGCGVRVTYAMTSPRPESVTCLACREYASRWHLRMAEQMRRLTAWPGHGLDLDQVRRAVDVQLDLARRFGADE
jgi:hypothetical protein